MLRSRAGARKRVRAYTDIDPVADEPEEEIAAIPARERRTFNMVGTKKFIRSCIRHPQDPANFINVEDADARIDFEDYYAALYEQLNPLGCAPHGQAITVDELNVGGKVTAVPRGRRLDKADASRNPIQGKYFPQLLEGMGHSGLLRIAASEGRKLLVNADMDQVEDIMRAYANGLSYRNRPEEIGLFLSWLFSSLPDRLMGQEHSVEILNKFIKLDPQLCVATFRSLGALAGPLLDRHMDTYRGNAMLDDRDTLNFATLRMFAFSHMDPVARPTNVRSVLCVPPPILCRPGREGDAMQREIRSAAHSTFSVLPGAWKTAEGKRAIALGRAARRARTRIKPSQASKAAAAEQRGAIAAASRLVAVTVEHNVPVVSPVRRGNQIVRPDDDDEDLPEYRGAFWDYGAPK